MKNLSFSWTDAVWGVPLISLMFLMNQAVYEATDGKTISLSDKELIDSLPPTKA